MGTRKCPEKQGGRTEFNITHRVLNGLNKYAAITTYVIPIHLENRMGCFTLLVYFKKYWWWPNTAAYENSVTVPESIRGLCDTAADWKALSGKQNDLGGKQNDLCEKQKTWVGNKQPGSGAEVYGEAHRFKMVDRWVTVVLACEQLWLMLKSYMVSSSIISVRLWWWL